ncbi:TIMELESS-interacting protein [Pistacia vera]|uniref:TIMELESS-interacting protein n=1 Tax=Pistacia vera TaxID=55513 RepID=UPI00126358C3|nr:TIMELESS-interacting protein [Pistacia vera]
MENAKAVPTGCFKCGRPGHWSRDCPSSSSSVPSNSNKTSGAVNVSKTATQEKPKKVSRTRPKLTPDLLLSDDGFGFVLRHFPRAFKCRGRGHEVSDLGNLIGLYSEWHSHLLPYYSFDQFIHKVEQVAASRRVKTCIRDLRERVATGGDPTKFHEAPVEHNDQTFDQAHDEAMSSDGPLNHHGDPSSNIAAAYDIQKDLLDEIYEKATESGMVGDDVGNGSSRNGSISEVVNSGGSCRDEVEITEEQRARMEANRLNALQRAAARARPSQAS